MKEIELKDWDLHEQDFFRWLELTGIPIRTNHNACDQGHYGWTTYEFETEEDFVEFKLRFSKL
jgi:hypothetical protein